MYVFVVAMINERNLVLCRGGGNLVAILLKPTLTRAMQKTLLCDVLVS